MLFKLILSHVIFEPRCSMIANRTIHPSCRSLKTSAKRNIPLTSSLCCCSLNIKDAGLLTRFYSTQGNQDGKRTRNTLGRENLKNMEFSDRETLRQRLNAFTSQDRKSSSIKRFEPCYRQIYPSKKRKATFKIPKKPPYIPAVYQRKTTSYRGKYEKMNLESVKGRRMQWPPLYPSKKRDYPQSKNPADRSNELPSWLLPLYSCKSCHNEDASSTSEARFSGGAFRRRMEIVESIKQIRTNQPILSHIHEKAARNEEDTRLTTVKTASAVESLKRKIDSMQDYLKAMRNMEAYRKKYQTLKMAQESEIAKATEPVRQAYARIYQTKPPTQAREVKVRESMGLGLAGTKPLDKPLASTSNTDQQLENARDVFESKLVHTPKKQHGDNVAQNVEVEPNTANKVTGPRYPTAETANISSVGEIHKESVVMIKQPSGKNQWNFSQKGNQGSLSNDKKILIFNGQTSNASITKQGRASPRQHQGEISDDSLMANHQSRNIKPAEEAKTSDAWTVESLKSRINVMKIKNSGDETGMKKPEDISLTRNGGEVKPKISQVALRSFHKEAGFKNPRGSLTPTDPIKLRLGYQRQVSRRSFSTFRTTPSARPVTKVVASRTISNASSNTSKKRNWVSRFKRCLTLKKIKGSKRENWKEAPREIPYGSEEMKFTSPAPILWKPSEVEIHKQSKPAEAVLKEKVNPAVLNAEQRVLASISRLIPTKQNDTPGVQIVEIEQKMKRAKTRVNMMPWLKRSKSAGTVQKLPQLTSSNNLEKDEPRESGYQWILKNRDMVEELKQQSRYAAGKPLVPTEVKNSINQYKVPLKAEISRYRKNMEQKCTDQFYLCSTSKRWYSTCYAANHRHILSCSRVLIVDTRGIKTTGFPKSVDIPSKFLYRTHSDNGLEPNTRGFNQGVSCKHRNVDDDNENSEADNRPKKWAWKIPNKTRAFTPKPTTLTSPNRIMGTRMSEMSPCALKKQVEELKSLIRKAREEVNEKNDNFLNDPQCGDDYEVRLKRLIKAAHNNAQKMQIMEPKYTSENNMLVSKPNSGKKKRPQAMIQYEIIPPGTSKPSEVSVLKSLFENAKGESNTLANEILSRNNLTSLPALASKKKTEKHASRVYLKLKSLVEAVRKKSAMLEPVSNMKLSPSESLKGSLSIDAVLPLSESTAKKSGESHDSQFEKASKATTPEKVELSAHRTPPPSSTIQLWKGDGKPKEFNYASDNEPNYSHLLNLFTKAKGLFCYQLPQNDITTDTKLGNKYMTSENELTKQWLSIREDVSNAARAVAGHNNEPVQVTEAPSQASPQHKDVGNVSEYMMNKSEMIPYDLLKSEPKITCENMWTSVPVKVLEDEDLCRKSNLETDYMNENPSTGQPIVGNTGIQLTTAQPKPQNPIIPIETPKPKNEIDLQDSGGASTKMLFQKSIMALGSLTKNFGSGMGMGISSDNTSEGPKHADSAVVSNDTTLKISDISRLQVEGLHSSNHHEMNFHDEKQTQSTSVGAAASKLPHVTDDTQEVMPHKVMSSPCVELKTEQHNQISPQGVGNMKQLEEKVKTYENYYRNYFAEDILNGYNHLHEVYDGLNELNSVGRTAFTITGQEDSRLVNSQASNQSQKPLENKTPIKTGACHGSTEIQSNRPKEAAETSHDNSSDHFNGNHVSSSSKAIFVSGVSGNEQCNACHESKQGESQRSTEEHIRMNDSQIQPVDTKYNTESYIDSEGTIQDGIRIQESESLGITNSKARNSKVELKDTEQQFSNLSGKVEPANFDELLTQDPTLNPEVVKNLKLPVILAEDCHTEKNWYTKYYFGNQQNR